jgi:hypothetical protein
MSTCANDKKVIATPMGTVDTLLGLIAAVVLKNKNHLIPVGDLYNILHELKQDDKFKDDLRYLDFEAVGDSYYSQALDEFLFQAGTWGLHQVPNPAVSSISLDEERAGKRLEALKGEFGEEAIRRLREEFATAFIEKLGSARAHE